jgi:Sel1 repeat
MQLRPTLGSCSLRKLAVRSLQMQHADQPPNSVRNGALIRSSASVRCMQREATSHRVTLTPRWYRKVADRNADAALRLAVMLINGTGVTQDYTEAMTLCESGAKKNYGPAEYCVGYLHLRGLGVTPDPKQAVKWFSEAAAQGFAKAALSLSEMYLKGEGVSVSRPDAFYFLYTVYKGGVYSAKDQARTLHQTLTKDETKRTEKILQEHSLDPKKVFAIVDDTTPHDPSQTREILPPVIR